MAFIKLTSPAGEETSINTTQITYLTDFNHEEKNKELDREYEDNKARWESGFNSVEPNEGEFKKLKKVFDDASTNVYLENRDCRFVKETQEEIRQLVKESESDRDIYTPK